MPRSPYVARLVTPDDSVAVKLREEPRYTKTWRGGDKDASIRLKEPLDSASPLLAPYSKLRLEDVHTGETRWEGYVDLPGKSRSRADGDVWDIGAVGSAARLSDRQRQWIGIDTAFEGWKFLYATKTSKMQAGTGALPAGAEEGADCLLLSWPNGLAVGDQDRVSMGYDRLWQTGQFVGGVQFTHREGLASTTQRTQLVVDTKASPGSDEVASNQPWVIVLTQSNAASAGGTQFAVGRDRAKLRIIRDGGIATNTGSEDWWAGVTKMRISALRRDINGDWISGANTYDNGYLLAHEAVIDALYWFTARLAGSDWIGSVDIAGSTIDASFAHQFDQLVYMEPTTVQQILEDCALFEPTMGWKLHPSNSNGQHPFELYQVADGSTIAGSAESGARYLATTADGWSSPGGQADTRNSVTVGWEDGTGKQQSETYLASDFDLEVDGLDQWAILRDADLVDLGTELGSQANADRIGEQILRRAAQPPESGTLTVDRPVVDTWTGQMVQGRDIEPGYPLLIQDLDIDPLPITDVDVDGRVATLTLSEPVLTDEQLINLFARRRRRRG